MPKSMRLWRHAPAAQTPRRIVSSVTSAKEKDQFDQEYMKAMVDGHREAEQMLAARPSEPPATEEPTLAVKVNKWVAKTLPAVRAHLKEAERVSSELNKEK